MIDEQTSPSAVLITLFSQLNFVRARHKLARYMQDATSR